MKTLIFVLKVLNNNFPLKPDLIRTPDIYLGFKHKLMQLENGVWVWGISPSKYVREENKNYKDYVSEHLRLGNAKWGPRHCLSSHL